MAYRKTDPVCPRGSGLRPRRRLVLVVDDVADNRDMYLEYLKFAGFDAAGAVDGATAVEAARALSPDVVLMDLSLPGMDGWEATRVLKADPLTRAIRVVALTGHAEATCREQAELAGFDLFLAKPCLPQELVGHICRLLDGLPIKGAASSTG